MGASSGSQAWPSLPLEAWSDTCATLHMWTQIVGKIRLVQSPWVNHSWHVTLYVTARGLTTSPIPHGTATFQIDFDFIDHQLIVQSSDGGVARFALEPQSVGDVLRAADGGDAQARPAREDPRQAERGCRTDPLRPGRGPPRVRSRSTPTASGASSCRRTGSSRRSAPASSASAAPCTSSGARPTWRSRASPDGGRRSIPGGIPNLPGLGDPRGLLARGQQLRLLARRRRRSLPRVLLLRLSGAGRVRASGRPARRGLLQQRLREFILPYDAVRQADSPDETLLEFLQTTYEAAADLASWDRGSLERGTRGPNPASRSSAATPGPGLASAGSGGVWQKLAPGR